MGTADGEEGGGEGVGGELGTDVSLRLQRQSRAPILVWDCRI